MSADREPCPLDRCDGHRSTIAGIIPMLACPKLRPGEAYIIAGCPLSDPKVGP